jgi:hypothetical protein
MRMEKWTSEEKTSEQNSKERAREREMNINTFKEKMSKEEG